MSLAEMTETSGNHINTLKVHQEMRKVETGAIDWAAVGHQLMINKSEKTLGLKFSSSLLSGIGLPTIFLAKIDP